MSLTEKYLELNRNLKGKKVVAAASELTAFSLSFDDGSGLLLLAEKLSDRYDIDARIMPSHELPQIGDAICKVEWAWIASSTIESIQCLPGSFKINFSPAGPLTISAQLWQGKAFLAFQPYKASS